MQIKSLLCCLLHHDPVWPGVSVSIAAQWTLLFSLWFAAVSGIPEDRTQRDSVISRVWATSPRLPFSFSRDGRTRTDVLVFPKHAGLPLPYIPVVHFVFQYPVGELNPYLRIESPLSWPLDERGVSLRAR